MKNIEEPAIKDVYIGLQNLTHTVDQLARSAARGFQIMDEKFEMTWKAMDRMNEEIFDIKKILKPTVQKVDRHDKDIGSLHERVSGLEAEIL